MALNFWQITNQLQNWGNVSFSADQMITIPEVDNLVARMALIFKKVSNLDVLNMKFQKSVVSDFSLCRVPGHTSN